MRKASYLLGDLPDPPRWRRGIRTAGMVLFGCLVGWSIAQFDTWRARRLELREPKIANVTGHQVPAPAPRLRDFIELKPSLTCAGILITTTDKNTSDEAVRDFSVVVDFSEARAATVRLSQGSLVVDYSEARAATVRLSQGDAEPLSANINLIDSLDILFSDSASWGKDGSIKQFINGDINRVRGTMYAYDTLWSEGGPVRIRHWYLQCKENWNPLVTCPPWGLGICLMRHSDSAPAMLPKLTTGTILKALSGGALFVGSD
jgi:hypothetical protein